ncbi:MAG TPA: NAD(P)-dependent alcohol dehydrogenase [Chitinophagales bacterium]|nr:NAD(P)-dependent alcohol dehydrogenase [Chitinophagales bacterium]
MISTKGYAAQSAVAPLAPFTFNRRNLNENDVLIDILYCGICHSDIHQVRNEWGGSIYPMVPGHEIVGRITQVGSAVKKFKVGDMAGVGCLVNSCRTCPSCQKGYEQYCENRSVGTYNSYELDGVTPTYGGYSDKIVTHEDFVLHVSEKLAPERVAPLLCAGITTYSPLRQWKVGKGHRLGVLGLGGLGHMAIKLGASMGAEVTVISTSPKKEKDALALGAHKFVVVRDKESAAQVKNYFDFIIDTVSAQHDLNMYLQMLRLDGTMIMVGIPPKPEEIAAFNLIGKRRRLAGSLIGGLPETQEMLDYCAANNIMSDVEVIKPDYINQAYERVLKSDVHYRFVIDMKAL